MEDVQSSILQASELAEKDQIKVKFELLYVVKILVIFCLATTSFSLPFLLPFFTSYIFLLGQLPT